MYDVWPSPFQPSSTPEARSAASARAHGYGVAGSCRSPTTRIGARPGGPAARREGHRRDRPVSARQRPPHDRRAEQRRGLRRRGRGRAPRRQRPRPRPVDAVHRQLHVGQVAVRAVGAPLHQEVRQFHEHSPVTGGERLRQRALQDRPFLPQVQRGGDPVEQHRAVGGLVIHEVRQRLPVRPRQQARHRGGRRGLPERAPRLGRAPGRELAERGLETLGLRDVDLEPAQRGIHGAVKHQGPHPARKLLSIRVAEFRSV